MFCVPLLKLWYLLSLLHVILNCLNTKSDSVGRTLAKRYGSECEERKLDEMLRRICLYALLKTVNLTVFRTMTLTTLVLLCFTEHIFLYVGLLRAADIQQNVFVSKLGARNRHVHGHALNDMYSSLPNSQLSGCVWNTERGFFSITEICKNARYVRYDTQLRK